MSETASLGLRLPARDGERERSVFLARKFMSMGHTAEEAAEFAEIDISLITGQK